MAGGSQKLYDQPELQILITGIKYSLSKRSLLFLPLQHKALAG
jgi:hypothetical protein